MSANIADTGVRGNHDSEGVLFRRYFPQPYQPGRFDRSFDYGPRHVVPLDHYTDYLEGSPQYDWLKEDLAASNKIWKVVVLPRPGWSADGQVGAGGPALLQCLNAHLPRQSRRA